MFCFNLNVNLIDMAFKSVTLRWTEHKSQKRETKQPYRVLMRKLLLSDDLEDCKDRSIILRWILGKQPVTLCSGFNWITSN